MDVREEILARLVQIGAGVDGIVRSLRNRDQLPSTDNLPAFLFYDADEEADDSDPRVRPANSPRRVTMSPTIVLIVSSRPEDIGTTANQYRAAFVRAVLTDETLLAHTLNGDGIRYGGCRLDLYQGEGLQGHMLIDLSFIYLLKPQSL